MNARGADSSGNLCPDPPSSVARLCAYQARADRRPVCDRKQNKQILIQCRRTAVTPIVQERPVLFSKMTPPEFPAVEIKRRQLPIAEPGVNALAIRHWSRSGQIVLLVILRPLPRGRDSVLPQPLPIGAAE